MKNKIKDSQISHSFDYDILESEQRLVVKQRTEEIKERLKRSAQDIWEIGQKLFEVRSQLAYGQFDSWLTTEFGWSRRTAYNFVRVYEAFPERATVAQVSIAASALYQLSSPSTPQKVREDFIQRAKDGEKITRQDIRSASNQQKTPPLNTAIESAEVTQAKQQIVSVIPQAIDFFESPVEAKPPQKEREVIEDSVNSQIQTEGWYSLEGKHFLFYGDTATAQFYQAIPQVALTIAITSNDWDHDWLIDKSDNLVVLKESFFLPKSISNLISLFSKPGDIVLFPWLPDQNIIELTHRLDRVIVAGDSMIERCRKAIAKSKLTVELISVPKRI